MDEAALIPTMVYVLFTVLLVAWAIRSFRWLELSGLTVTVVALLVLLESGIAYEGVKTALEH